MVPDFEIGIILDACWISLEESRRHPQYWQTLTAFIQAIYQPFLVMAPEESTIITKLNKVLIIYWCLACWAENSADDILRYFLFFQ